MSDHAINPRAQVTTADAEAHHHDTPHALPLWLLIGTFALLIFFTYVTVAVTAMDLGGTGNFVVAMTIAVVKSALVMMIFMHLWWDSPFNTLAIIAAIAFVILFIAVSIGDTSQYKKNIAPPGQTSPPSTVHPVM